MFQVGTASRRQVKGPEQQETGNGPLETQGRGRKAGAEPGSPVTEIGYVGTRNGLSLGGKINGFKHLSQMG